MPDEAIEELRQIKDAIARVHQSDVRRLAMYPQGRERSALDQAVGRLPVDEVVDEDEAVGPPLRIYGMGVRRVCILTRI